jgi:hypothetical protein
VRAVFALAPVALLASSCGGSKDPVAMTLAQKSEHVEIKGTVTAGGKTQPFSASGDFTNDPDQGTMIMQLGGATVREVITGSRVYLSSKSLGLPKGRTWLSVDASQQPGVTQTPAQILRSGKKYPMRVEDGLVRHIDVTTPQVTMSMDLSRFGEPVQVHVPAAATTIRKDVP